MSAQVRRRSIFRRSSAVSLVVWRRRSWGALAGVRSDAAGLTSAEIASARRYDQVGGHGQREAVRVGNAWHGNGAPGGRLPDGCPAGDRRWSNSQCQASCRSRSHAIRGTGHTDRSARRGTGRSRTERRRLNTQQRWRSLGAPPAPLSRYVCTAEQVALVETPSAGVTLQCLVDGATPNDFGPSSCRVPFLLRIRHCTVPFRGIDQIMPRRSATHIRPPHKPPLSPDTRLARKGVPTVNGGRRPSRSDGSVWGRGPRQVRH
jgi:hypothetical protein